MSVSRTGRNNPNWRGGISQVRTADEILSLDDCVIEEIYRRFLALIHRGDESECWAWIGGAFKSNGRAKLVLGVNLLASKVGYVLYKGPTGGMCVLHTCDNVLCVNPDHLWLGTNADNSADMVLKGRSLDQTGSLNHAAKLDETQVANIKSDLRSGMKQNKVAQKYGVSKQTITLIKQCRRWGHVQ